MISAGDKGLERNLLKDEPELTSHETKEEEDDEDEIKRQEEKDDEEDIRSDDMRANSI